MNPIPADAKRLTAEHLAMGMIPLEIGKEFAWTRVIGHAVEKIQTAEGSGKGQKVYDVEYRCPRCTEEHHITFTTLFDEHPVRCHCELTLCFVVAAQ